MIIIDKILSLTRQLYPRGRAFKLAFDSNIDKLNRGLSQSEFRLVNDALSTLDSAIPDNPNFTTDDATDWERRLGLVSNPMVSLSDRKKAIIRKMNHPGTIKARQHYLYLQGQLQAAGFNVYVYENIFSDGMGGFVTKTPGQFSLISFPTVGRQHRRGNQHGNFQHGGSFGNMVANSIYQSVDNLFSIGSNLRSTFFIGGSTAGTWADVDANREIEFRQLILKVKPTETVAFLLINYI